MNIITIQNLVKKFNQHIAVDNVSLNIEEGEIFGLLGPNGAGKSTVINCLCGLLRFDQGEILVDGLPLKNNMAEVKRRLGLVPQEIAIFDTLTARENVAFFGKLAGLRGVLLKERVEEALEFAGLSVHDKTLPKGFSGGMKRRLNIACAIAHHPKIIIMDEPTVGIDPQSRKHILDSVRQLNRTGSTVIYTSHYMEEVEAICGRIAIIDHGRLIAEGTREELRNLVTEEEKILIRIGDASFNAVQEIKALNGVKEVLLTDKTLEIITANTQLVMQDILFILTRQGTGVKRVDVVEPDLESVFLSLTGRKLRD